MKKVLILSGMIALMALGSLYADEPIFIQPYDLNGSAYTSSYDSTFPIDYKVADNFSGLSMPITKVAFFGITPVYNGGAWTPSNPSAGEPCVIRFYNFVSLATEPDWSTPAVSYSVTAATTYMEEMAWGGYSIYKFEVTLPAPVAMADGWVSLQLSQPTSAGAWFLWVESATGDGISYQTSVGGKKGSSDLAGINLPSSDNPKEALGSDQAFIIYGASGYTFEVNAYDLNWYVSMGYSFPTPVPAFNDPNDLGAEILFNGASFTPPVYTPYTFGQAGKEAFVPGTYGVSYYGYIGWLPVDITFMNITTSYAADFLGYKQEVIIDGTTPPPVGVTIIPGGDNGMPGTDGGMDAVVYTVTTTGVWDVVVHRPVGYPYPWYAYLNTSPMLASGPIMTDVFTFISVDFGLVKGPVVVTLDDDEDLTLPVELSSFNAVQTAQNDVKLSWVSQSETDLLGYRVYRNGSLDQANAVSITPVMVPATNTSTTASYSITDSEVSIGSTYYYWLESIDMGSNTFHGPVSVIVEGEVPPVIPTATAMSNAYPNPFSIDSATTIDVQVKAGDNGTVTIYNILGQAVKTFQVSEGPNPLSWNGRDSKGNSCGSGVYFYKLSTPSINITRKMLIVK